MSDRPELAAGLGRTSMRLEEKRVFVTGGASGIGAAIAARFREEGARLIVGDIRPGPDDIALDVRLTESVSSAVAAAVERLGGLDVLICNAGRAVVGRTHELPEEEWADGLATNLTGVFLMVKAAWPHLVRSRGCILATASTAGLVPIGANQAAYCTAKAGVVMLMRCLALEGASFGIRANCVCPGFTDTPMLRQFIDSQPDPEAARQAAVRLHPLGRIGAPTDIANAFVYLASDEAAWVTGAALTVDGGLLSGILADPIV
jgi:meso-butanediol dehydrogenase/(S,S)-butanediol dehydrogenase/diacetyl reductase